mgnify:CR=1 FL=1
MAIAATELDIGSCHIWGAVRFLNDNEELLKELSKYSLQKAQKETTMLNSDVNGGIFDAIKNNASAEQIANLAQLSDKNLNAAKIMVAIIPLLLIYPMLQKYFVTGMVVGSVKE